MGVAEEFVIGRVIKAMNSSWHPNCFLCQLCDAPLADAGFIKSAGRSVTIVTYILLTRAAPIMLWPIIGQSIIGTK